jgi:hypothetical protein
MLQYTTTDESENSIYRLANFTHFFGIFLVLTKTFYYCLISFDQV